MTGTSRWVGVALLLCVALALGVYAWQQQRETPPGEPVGGPVELASTQGHFSLTQLDADQFAVLFFGYTHCPDVCPMSLAVMRQTLQGLDPEQRRRIVPVMISVDPERDTLARLSDYVGHFGEAFIGATGSEAQLTELAERYGVVWRRVAIPDSALGYTVDHTAALYVVDRHGEIRRRVLYSPTAGPLQAALEALLDAA